MAKPRIADLFCGAGGAAMGLHRAGFTVVGFDIVEQPRYPFEFHQQDALTVDMSGFDAVWASPPCQHWVDSADNAKHPNLITPLRPILQAHGGPYIIENVDRAPLINPVRLCGTFFGLRVIRHRLFEHNGPLILDTPCNHWGSVANGDFAPVYGHAAKGRRYIEVDEGGKRVRKRIARAPEPEGITRFDWWSQAMGIDWMKTYRDLTEAIPPAYSKYLGRQLLLAMGAADA